MKEKIGEQGRVNQKLKTRLEILKAARVLMVKSHKISLEDVAKKANVSRATIYRYFSSIDMLVTETSLQVKHKSSDEIVAEVQDSSFADRILQIQDHYVDAAQENETVFRRYLSAILSESIVSKKQLRGARRIETLKKALTPFENKLSTDTYTNLINTAAVLMGIDPVVTCRDVCKLNKQETKETLTWALELILKGIQSEYEGKSHGLNDATLQ